MEQTVPTITGVAKGGGGGGGEGHKGAHAPCWSER